MNLERAAPGPVVDAVQPVMSRDRAVAAPCADGIQTVVGLLDGSNSGEKRLMSNAGSREAQAVENPTEPPPTNPVLVAPQQVQMESRIKKFINCVIVHFLCKKKKNT